MRHRLTRASLLLAALPILSLAAGCAGGTEPSDSSPQMAGTWVGTYSVSGANAVFDYTLVLFPGDSMHAVDGLDPLASPKAVGTWSRAGDGIRATYSYLVGGGTYSLEGTLDTASDALTGSWGAGENPTGGGAFSVRRQ